MADPTPTKSDLDSTYPPPAAPQDPLYPPNAPTEPPRYDSIAPQQPAGALPYPSPGLPYPAPGPVPGQGPAPMAGPGPTAMPYQTTDQPIVIAAVSSPLFREYPVNMNCMNCHQDVTSRLQYVSGNLTILLAVGMCFFGFIFGCCLIPFCIDGCKDVVHKCPSCSRVLGTFKRL